MNEENLPPKPKFNLKYILIVVILAALAGGGIFVYTKYINKQLTSLVKIPETAKNETANLKREIPIFSYGINDKNVTVSMPRYGIIFKLNPGWRAFTITDSPIDVLTKEFEDKIIEGSGGSVPWFIGGEKALREEFPAIAYFTLVSPRYWDEISETESSKLSQYGDFGWTTIRELTREIEVIILRKRSGQSLNQFLNTFDELNLRGAEEGGHSTKEYMEEQRKGFLGNFENKEEVTLSDRIQTALLSGRTTPGQSGTALFLFFSCSEGNKVVVVGSSADQGIDYYLNEFRSLRDNSSFTGEFCNKK